MRPISYENRYNDDKVYDACGLIGVMDVTGERFSAHDIVKVPLRGRFYIREELVALALLDRVRSLEERLIRKGVTLDRRPRMEKSLCRGVTEASGSEPTTVDKEAG